METTLDRFGRVLLPKRVRRRLGLEPGDVLEIVEDQGSVRLQPVTEEAALVWKGNVLVHQGVPTGDLTDSVQRDREKRMRHVLGLLPE